MSGCIKKPKAFLKQISIAYFCSSIYRLITMKKFLIVGLGNVGADYAHTRHNIGFSVLDHLAEQEQLSFENVKYGLRALYRFKGRQFILLKPNTMMNLSGKAVKYWLEKEKVPLENLLIIVDDLNIPFGEIRLKTKGSNGGHNGLKDIEQKLGTRGYSRFRFGIGHQYATGNQINYVLGKWNTEEQKALVERLETAAELIRSYGTAGADITMNRFNGK